MDQEFLSRLANDIEEYRPDVRRAKKIFITTQTPAILMDNLIIKDGVSFELKPKWGFLDPSTSKSSKCRFCIHNQLKTLMDSSLKSLYCPMDLFSRDLSKVGNALQNLVKTPQNNLRYFKFGQQIANIIDIVQDQELEALSMILASHPILEILGKAQEAFHDDILELAHQYSKENQDDIDLMLIENLESIFQNQEMAQQTLSNRIARFLISLTLKDLSIIITLKHGASTNEESVKGFHSLASNMGRIVLDKLSYDFTIKVIDLDPKKASKLDHLRDLEISLQKI